MKEIIQEILQAEEKVGTFLEQARNKASEIKLSAEKEASEKTGEAKQKSREMIQAAVENARKEAEHIKQDRLGQAALEKDALLKNNADKINRLVDDICKIILTTEYDKEQK